MSCPACERQCRAPSARARDDIRSPRRAQCEQDPRGMERKRKEPKANANSRSLTAVREHRDRVRDDSFTARESRSRSYSRMIPGLEAGATMRQFPISASPDTGVVEIARVAALLDQVQ